MERAKRDSNLELLRIVMMLAIIAHHYVVNSGVREMLSFSGAPLRTTFLWWWGLWGKGAIDAFVMITGYFMCTSRITLKRFLKLYLEVAFYWTLLAVARAVLVTGEFNLGELVAKLLLWPAKAGPNGSFIRSFMLFFLMIPLWNLFVERLGKEGLQRAIAGLVAVYVGIGTFFDNTALFNEVFWYGTLFLIAAYLRMHAGDWSRNPRFSRWLFIASVLLGMASVPLARILRLRFTFFLSSPARLCAFLFGVSAFLFFKNLRVPHSNAVNTVASTTFGILMFHANSYMRNVYFKGSVFGFMNVCDAYANHQLPYLVCHAVGTVLLVFVCGCLFDLVRIKVFEEPFFALYDRHAEAIEGRLGRLAHGAQERVVGIARAVAERFGDGE